LEDELLGTMPDKQFARKFKRSVIAVFTRRTHKRVPVFDRQRRRWTPADDKLLSERTDAQIALFLGISPTAVRHRRRRLGIPQPGRRRSAPPRPWKPEEDALLGTATDVVVGRRLGRTSQTVRHRRYRLGIRTSGHHWTPEADALLGKMPDRIVAQRLGCTAAAVRTRRKKLGIPPAR
jgi:hypothetical protein